MNKSLLALNRIFFSSRFLNSSSSCILSQKSSISMNAFQHNKKLGVISAPFDRGQPEPGTEDGPDICRSSGFIKVLEEALKYDVKDYGSLDFGLPKRTPNSSTSSQTKGPRNLPEVAHANKIISDAVEKILRDDRVCLTLGGDHSIGIGTVHGSSMVYDDLALLWVDAHADINTISTSYTGNMHGMPVAFIVEELETYMTKFPEFSWIKPRVKAQNIAYIGLRDVDFSERLLGQYNRSIIEKTGITAYSMKEVDEHGIQNVIRMALDKISPRGCRPVHLSFDIDSLDDLEVRATGTPVPGGLSAREAMSLLEEVHKSGLMVAMDFVEVNPKLGTDLDVKRTKVLIRHLISAAFGYYRGGLSRGELPTP